MAEQFVIRIETEGPSSTTARGSDQWKTEAAGAGLLLGGGLSERQQFDQMQKLVGKTRDVFGEGDDIKFVTRVDQDTLQRKGKIIQKVSAMTSFEAAKEGPDGKAIKRQGEHLSEVRQLNPVIMENRAKIIAAGTALGLKTANAYISHKQYRSGDSFYNDQLNNRMKLAQYGIALSYGAAKGGVAGFALVAAGIAVNEGINAVTENANYNYDRMMDTLYVHNTREVAGDLSYGRRRRGDR